jgi:GNAT superfamily N-acetyltransferase
MSIIFRKAEPKDTWLILEFIRGLAEYEKLLDEVVADENTLRDWIFTKNKAEVIFAVLDDEEIGFAFYFYNFSTFLGRAGIYIEDLYIKPKYRGKGYGKALLKEIARIAVEQGCGRLEFWCLD